MTQSIDQRQAVISEAGCFYTKVFGIISNKWTARVIYALEGGTLRHGELRRRVEGVSQKMLTQTLRQLERDGLVSREVTPTVPPAVDYSLTPLGRTLQLPMRHLKDWTTAHYLQVEQARAAYDRNDGPFST